MKTLKNKRSTLIRKPLLIDVRKEFGKSGDISRCGIGS